MPCHAHKHKISGRRQNNLRVCSINDSRSWSHMSTRTTDGTYLKEAFASSSKKSTRNKEKKKMAIAKRFALQANAINRKNTSTAISHI